MVRIYRLTYSLFRTRRDRTSYLQSFGRKKSRSLSVRTQGVWLSYKLECDIIIVEPEKNEHLHEIIIYMWAPGRKLRNRHLLAAST